MFDHQQLYQTPKNHSRGIQHGNPKTKQLKRFPIIPIGPSIAYIPLTQGQFALIDSDDVDLIGANNWYAQWNGGTKSFYAFREITGKKKLGMHGFLLAPADGFVPDHANGITLDNRRANLRPATISQNAMNGRVRSDSRVGLRGVSQRYNRFEAKIRINGVRHYLGTFATPEAAHQAYRDVAAMHHGEFRRAA